MRQSLQVKITLILFVSFLSACHQIDPFWTSVEGHYEKILKLAERFEFADTINTVVCFGGMPFYRGYVIAGDEEGAPFVFVKEHQVFRNKNIKSYNLSSSQRYGASIAFAPRDPKSPLSKSYDYWDISDLVTGNTTLKVTDDKLREWIMEGSDYTVTHVSLWIDNAVIRWSPDEKAVYYRIYVTFGTHRQDTGKFGPSGYMIMKTDLETKQHRIVYTARVKRITLKSGQIGKEEDSIMNFWVFPDGERILTDEIKRTYLKEEDRTPEVRVFVMVDLKTGKGTEIYTVGSKSNPAFSSDGKYVYFFDDRGLVQMVASGPDRQRVIFKGRGEGLSVSPEGKRFALNDGRGIVVVTLPEKEGESSKMEVIARTPLAPMGLRQTTWSRDGRFLGGCFMWQWPGAPGAAYAHHFVTDLKEKKFWANEGGNYWSSLAFIENPEVIRALWTQVEEAKRQGRYRTK